MKEYISEREMIMDDETDFSLEIASKASRVEHEHVKNQQLR
jgi:hypothetical protein